MGSANSMMHFHPHPEVFVQLSGVSRQVFPAGHLDIRAGEIALIPRWLPHSEEARPRRMPFRNFVIGFYPDGLWTHIAAANGRLPRVLGHFGIEIPRVQRLWEYMDDALEASSDRSVAARAAVRGTLLAFFGTVLRAVRGELGPRRGENPKVTRARQLIAEHLSDRELSVDSLADMIGCSADYLSHLFHVTTGHRLSVYVNAQRVAHAKLMLSTTSMNVSEVADACGYADPGYFARQFRKIAGHTASVYRTQVEPG
jgi:AraC-like DNA-binding protein